MKTFILDTNVLVGDPKSIFKFGENKVVIPITVLQELDGLKKRGDSVGQSARQVARDLDELRERGRLDKGVRLDNSGWLCVETNVNEPSFKTNKQPIPDHYILQIAIDISNRESKDAVFENNDVVLVTEDSYLRILADSMGVNAQRYKEMQVDDISFYDDTRIVKVSESEFKKLTRENVLNVEVPKLENNTFVEVRCEDADKYSELDVYALYSTGALLMLHPRQVYGIEAKNREQVFALDALMDPAIRLVALAGKAGTGKTILSIAAGLEQVTELDVYKKMVIARPVVSVGKELGFLPGSLEEKLEPWMGPIHDSLDFLFRNAASDNYSQESIAYFKQRNQLDIMAIQYIRGRSLPDQFLLIDEAQNLTPHEIATIITRAGKGTKVVLTGDPYQIDSPYLDQYNNGLSYVIDKFQGNDMFANVTLNKGERSELAETAAKLLT